MRPNANISVSEAIRIVKERDEARARLAELESKLYLTSDGVRVVPNVDPVWIDPDDSGWFGEPVDYGRFDEHDNRVAPEPIKLTRWVAHKDHNGAWDHIWMERPADPWRDDGAWVGDHWQGDVYSSREACLAARGASGGGGADPIKQHGKHTGYRRRNRPVRVALRPACDSGPGAFGGDGPRHYTSPGSLYPLAGGH